MRATRKQLKALKKARAAKRAKKHKRVLAAKKAARTRKRHKGACKRAFKRVCRACKPRRRKLQLHKSALKKLRLKIRSELRELRREAHALL